MSQHNSEEYCCIVQLVAEVCRRLEARVRLEDAAPSEGRYESSGLTSAEAEYWANELLRVCQRQNDEYPYCLETPSWPDYIVSLDAQKGAEAVAPEMAEPPGAADEGVCRHDNDRTDSGAALAEAEALLAILRLLMMIGAVSVDLAASLGQQIEPARISRARRSNEEESPAYLLPIIARLLADAEITAAQRDVARRILERGSNTAQIARELGITQEYAQTLWQRSRGPLRTALIQMAIEKVQSRNAGPISTADVMDIHRQEVARRGYDGIQHCPRGYECCRHGDDRACPFAVPLSDLREHSAYLASRDRAWRPRKSDYASHNSSEQRASSCKQTAHD